MLVLTRKAGEKIHIGSDVVITVLELPGQRVRIGIEAAPHVTVLRGELLKGASATRPEDEHGG